MFDCFVLSRQNLYVAMVVCIFGCTRSRACRFDGDVICVGHDLLLLLSTHTSMLVWRCPSIL